MLQFAAEGSVSFSPDDIEWRYGGSANSQVKKLVQGDVGATVDESVGEELTDGRIVHMSVCAGGGGGGCVERAVDAYGHSQVTISGGLVEGFNVSTGMAYKGSLSGLLNRLKYSIYGPPGTL